MEGALGLIEVIGLVTAVTALDAACKNADVVLAGCQKVIGVERAISVTVQIVGQVAAVKSAVDAGVTAAEKVGKVVSSHVIPRPHEEIDKLISNINKELEQKKKQMEQKIIEAIKNNIKNKEEN